jgi:predicted PurR-regulated permease PerM
MPQVEKQVPTSAQPAAPAPRASVSLRLLVALAIGTLLYLGHAAFIPIALAALFSLILTGPVETLHRIGLPRSLAATLVLVLLVGLIGGSINLLWTPAQNWWASAPQTLQTIGRKVRPISQFITRVEVLTARADQIAETGAAPTHAADRTVTAAPEHPPAAAGATTPIAEILDQTRSVVIGIVTVLMLMLFMLAGGPPMLARLSAALARDLQSTQTLLVIQALRTELSRYYGGLALVNLGLAFVTAGAMALLGMPNPLLWGAVAGVLNFIPYVGSLTTLLLLTVVAFVTFSSAGHAVLVTASYLVIATIEGQLVQPLVVGRRLDLNPIMVFLALWFAGWFWGVAGIVMAVPALVSLKVVAANSAHGAPLMEFLSPNKLLLKPLGRARSVDAPPAQALPKRASTAKGTG